jgi:hydrogenase maturation protease
MIMVPEPKQAFQTPTQPASTVANVLVVGIGSPHGDDRAGWVVVEALRDIGLPGVQLHQAKVPHELLDSLEEHSALHLIDSCTGMEECNLPRRFAWQGAWLEADDRRWTLQPGEMRSSGTHHVDLLTVLELARCLNRLPEQVVLWTVPGRQFQPGTAMTQACHAAASECVRRLVQELGHA